MVPKPVRLFWLSSGVTNFMQPQGSKYDKQDQQGKAAFNERNPHMTQQQEPMARSPGGPQTKTGQGKDRARTG
jgi:hypothetical protein